MSTEQMTREEAYDLAFEELKSEGPEEWEVDPIDMFNYGADWQKSQPCPRCATLEEENKRLREALSSIATSGVEVNTAFSWLKTAAIEVLSQTGGV